MGNRTLVIPLTELENIDQLASEVNRLQLGAIEAYHMRDTGQIVLADKRTTPMAAQFWFPIGVSSFIRKDDKEIKGTNQDSSDKEYTLDLLAALANLNHSTRKGE